MILLDYRDRRPIYEQVTEKFQELMIRGFMEQDSPMPSVRSLATDLSINPNTIQRAYAELERQGYIYTIKGKGSFVAENSGIKELKKQEILKQMAVLVEKGCNLGWTKHDMIEKFRELFEEGGEMDDRSVESDKEI